MADDTNTTNQDNASEPTKEQVVEEVKAEEKTAEVSKEKPQEEESSDVEVVEEAPIEETKAGENPIEEFRVGDTIKLNYKIIEGDKTRLQPYQGIVIAKKGTGISKTFTVRKISVDRVGVERIFPLFSPNIERLKVIKHGKVRRAKLYYLRDRVGKQATRIKERK